MNCLQNLPRFCASPLQGTVPRGQLNKISAFGLLEMRRADSRRITVVMNAQSNSPSGSGGGVEAKEQMSDVYSSNMTQAMGAVLTYRHELGMNYDFIRPDLIVGSCLQTPEDVDKLRKIGVRTIFCLQQNSDLEYFSVDIKAIQEYAAKFVDIEHCRAEIRDFDAFDLRMRLPSVVKTLHKKINKNGGITYIHCTAGLGRAPAVTLAYMFWIQGYKLMEAHKLLLSKRSCFPKLEAIKGATADILTGLSKSTIKLMWGGKGCSSVEVAGLDIGWGQKIPLKYDDGQGAWVLEKELPEGKYEYKYIIDGDQWTCNEDDLMTKPNGDGHVNNYIKVHDNRGTETMKLRERLMSDDIHLTVEERRIIRDFMDSK